MASELPDALRELAISTRRLNELTDGVNEAVERLEKLLAELNLGIEVWVSFDDKHKKGTAARRKLGYQRSDKDREYHIVFRTGNNPPLFWSQLSRERKIEAAVVLPALLREIAATVKRHVSNAEAALAEVSQVLPLSELAMGGTKKCEVTMIPCLAGYDR